MIGSPVKYWLVLVCLLAAFYASFVVWRGSRAELETPGRHAEPGALAVSALADVKSPPLTDFVLTDQTGTPFDSKSLRGKVWVGSFFFTNCAGSCWRLNQALTGLQQSHPDSQARFISITCDPDNDTPEALAKYAESFKADPAQWTFLTGDFKLIHRLGNDFFKVAVEKGTHTDRAFVVDRQGRDPRPVSAHGSGPGQNVGQTVERRGSRRGPAGAARRRSGRRAATGLIPPLSESGYTRRDTVSTTDRGPAGHEI